MGEESWPMMERSLRGMNDRNVLRCYIIHNQTRRTIGYIKLVQSFTRLSLLLRYDLIASSQKYLSLRDKDTILKTEIVAL